MTAQELLNWANDQFELAKNQNYDYQYIVYILRDNPYIIDAGLNDLCWSMTSPDFCGYISEGDMEGLLELFEERINNV